MRFAIIGSRDFNDYDFLKSSIFDLYFIDEIDLIISGGARGADKLAERFADDYGFEKHIIKADWDKYGKSAGFKRNTKLIHEADVVFAFWDGVSRGTKDSITKAKNQNKRLHVIIY